LLIFMWSPQPPSGPAGEAEACPGAGWRAIAGTIVQPAESEMLERAGDAYPVADFGVPRIELLARQGVQGGRILLAQRPDDLAAELLVDGEVAEPTGRYDADPQALRIAFDRLANRLAEPVAAPRRRLIRRVICVEHDRNDRHCVLHEAPVDEAEG